MIEFRVTITGHAKDRTHAVEVANEIMDSPSIDSIHDSHAEFRTYGKVPLTEKSDKTT